MGPPFAGILTHPRHSSSLFRVFRQNQKWLLIKQQILLKASSKGPCLRHAGMEKAGKAMTISLFPAFQTVLKPIRRTFFFRPNRSH